MRRLAVVLPLLSLLLALPALGQVDAVIRVNGDRLQGTHGPSGQILLYTPRPVSPGSSVSHWDTSPSPNLLMEPFATSDLPFLGLDITPGQMQDVGWGEGNLNVNIFSFDPPGSGFLDDRPFAGAPGNAATTLGEARQNLFAAVLGAWGNVLASDVDVDVIVLWAPLPCDPNFGAVLAAAGTISIFYDDAGGLPFNNTWYPGALTEALVGEDLTGTPQIVDGQIEGGDIVVFMNESLDDECLGEGTGWYYGFDTTPPPGMFDQASTVLHELGHGLGFASFTDETTGEQIQDLPSIFDRYTFDQELGKTWAEMTNAERVASAINYRKVTWSGEQANLLAAEALAPGVPELMVTAPAEAAGVFEVGTAGFGPPIPDGGLPGEIACLLDSGQPKLGDNSALDGCEPAINPGEVAGKIALIDRGTCSFVTKVANAQAAGAVGAIIVNTRGLAPVGLGGDDPTIAIPSISVGALDGNRIRQAACPGTASYLGGDRFQVTTHWWRGENEGQGQAGMLGEKTAYFSFFQDDNVEVTVKVLDACNLAGFNDFWVFSAGMTDVETLLLVTDTLTGEQWGYYNPPNRPFPPIQDTQAFYSCP